MKPDAIKLICFTAIQCAKILAFGLGTAPIRASEIQTIAEKAEKKIEHTHISNF